MRFIVTGTPRSATGYASLLFRELAIPCTHERIFKPRGAMADVLDWYEHADAGESSWLAWAFLGLLPGKVPVLHTMRNPWAVVDSLAHRNNLLPREAQANRDRGTRKLVDAMKAYCPEAFAYDGDIDRAAAFVVGWNRRIANAIELYQFPYRRYRVEELDAERIDELLTFIGAYRDAREIDSALQNVPSNVHRGKRIHHNVEISNPQIVDALKAIAPDVSATINQFMTEDIRRGADELGSQMDPMLRDALYALADEQGYTTSATVDVPQEEGVLAC